MSSIKLHMFSTDIDPINDICDYCGYMTLDDIADLIAKEKPSFISLCTVLDDGSLMAIAEFLDGENGCSYEFFEFRAIGWITNFTWSDIQIIQDNVRIQLREKEKSNG